MIAKLKQLNAEFGVSGSAIAKKSGVSHNIVKNLLSGRTKVISNENVIKLQMFIKKLHDATDI